MVLYHGTDDKSANNIVKNGIDLYSGSLHTDFGPGFYTTPDIKLAEIWAKRKGIFSRGAVVSYVIDEEYLGKVSDITRFLQEEGLAVDDDVLREMTRKVYSDQYSFHTPGSLKALTNPKIRLL